MVKAIPTRLLRSLGSGRAMTLGALIVLGLVTTNAQAPDPWIRRSASPKDFAVAKLPWRSFSIELPKDWVMAPGHGGTLLTIVEKPKNNQSAASIVLEQMRLAVPLTRNEIDAGLAELEANATRTRDPAGQNFRQQVKEIEGRRIVFVSYTRPGLNGTDSVVQYAIPSGNVMYRLVCIAPVALMTQRYQATFAHVAASFKPAEGSTN